MGKGQIKIKLKPLLVFPSLFLPLIFYNCLWQKKMKQSSKLILKQIKYKKSFPNINFDTQNQNFLEMENIEGQINKPILKVLQIQSQNSFYFFIKSQQINNLLQHFIIKLVRLNLGNRQLKNIDSNTHNQGKKRKLIDSYIQK
ncbi:unnamed protein product [Paramecium sonneborni]|uniref:Transmembrane protein n=1 Tax=Paramecium sonneborni TaxID=65129 RepID=A0A8S1PXS8_9CILI|nr:unnamed protein product [Paramecium sonneborni]